MCKLCVFAGTTEGRELVEFLAGQNAQVYACVATEYGQTLLPPFPNVTVSAARLTQPENSGRVNTPLAREASAAYRLKDATDNPIKIKVRIRNCGIHGAPWSMN